MPYAEVAVDAPIRDGRTFTYSIPTHLSVVPGQMVQVPFGPRMADGVVIRISETTQIDPVRPVEAADSLGPVVSSSLLELAQWIAEHYRAPLYSAVALMLPPGFRTRTAAYVGKPSQEVLETLEAPLRGRLADLFQGRRQRVAEALVREGLGREAQRSLDQLLRRGTVPRTWRWRVLRVGTPLGTPVAQDVSPEAPLTPTSHQAQVLEQIMAALEERRHEAFLVQGVTGSGKTEVYLQALARCLAHGRKGIVLVPEISLTPQMVQRFEARFPGRVAVLHSRLASSEHRRMWWGIIHGLYGVVIGSRSALFSPVDRLGLIVLDEEHEWTYKQQDTDPRYHARAVALRLGQQVGAAVVLGSATPDVVTYHNALSGQRLRLFDLPHRLGAGAGTQPSPLPEVQVVDMRRELREGSRGIFSRALQAALRETIQRGDQAILFLNRRGAAGVVQCRDCGHVLRCRSCDTPLTYHTAPERLLCHQCNRRSSVVSGCPGCRSARIRYLGLGTQRVVQEVEALLPGVATLRWDRDVAALDRATEGVLERFARGKAQVLVGTQMVAKGLHIPSVTLVGVVLADIGLNLPDFRAGERTFQLLCQVAGRAGRGASPGTAIVQTYRPDHYAVMLAAQQDYPAFYQQEVNFRRVQRLPPFSRLVRLFFAHTNAERCQGEAERLGRALRHQRRAWSLEEVDVLGPAPAYPPRLRGQYRWHILLRGPAPEALLDRVDLSAGWVVDVDPVSLL